MMALDAKSIGQTMSVLGAGTFGGWFVGGNYAFVMGIVTGGTSHFAVRIQWQDDAELLFHVLHNRQQLDRGFDHMVKISGVISANHMASLAKHFEIPDELDIFIARAVFIGLFRVAIQTGLDHQITCGLYLGMGVEPYVVLFIVALVAEIGFLGKWCAPQRNLIDAAFSALAIDIMTGETGKFVVLERKLRWNLGLFFIGGHDVHRMDITAGSFQVAFAQYIEITIRF
ncbi:MAG: hypothetical protein JSW39_17355 [Desulfobacterales bacterium]|nr:MAG: hypothetical protein JSW39_17355 [Desulfobacterales bacterium]